MRYLIRLFLGVTAKPFLKWHYLKFERMFQYDHLRLSVHKSVFHPGLFFSSKFFAGFIKTLELKDKRVLDVGCGSGLLSLVAANCGASVTSIDINETAVVNTKLNAEKNGLALKATQSDLFDNVEGLFDYIIVNPPYFPKTPNSPDEFAWYCGENYNYFNRFFNQLKNFTRDNSITYMILSDQCDVKSIADIASKNGFTFKKTLEKDFYIEKNLIFEIALL